MPGTEATSSLSHLYLALIVGRTELTVRNIRPLTLAIYYTERLPLLLRLQQAYLIVYIHGAVLFPTPASFVIL